VLQVMTANAPGGTNVDAMSTTTIANRRDIAVCMLFSFLVSQTSVRCDKLLPHSPPCPVWGQSSSGLVVVVIVVVVVVAPTSITSTFSSIFPEGYLGSGTAQAVGWQVSSGGRESHSGRRQLLSTTHARSVVALQVDSHILYGATLPVRQHPAAGQNVSPQGSRHPWLGSHLLPGPQSSAAPPMQAAAPQVSPWVQALPSSQVFPSSGGYEHTPARQLAPVAVWQAPGALHTTGVPPMRQPGWHCVSALFCELPAGAQTRPGQHCASSLHLDCGAGAAGLHAPSASAGRVPPSRSPTTSTESPAQRRAAPQGALERGRPR